MPFPKYKIKYSPDPSSKRVPDGRSKPVIFSIRDRLHKAEHGPHGWVVDTDRVSKLQPDREFRVCPCGWYGWVDK